MAGKIAMESVRARSPSRLDRLVRGQLAGRPAGRVTWPPVFMPIRTPVTSRALPGRRCARPASSVAVALLVGAAPVLAQEAPDEILVLAASSLTDVLPRVAAAWEANGGAAVRFSFDATSRLARQAVAGARADVFFAADQQWMRWLEDEGLVGSGQARIVAGNELVVIVPDGAFAPRAPSELIGLDRVALANENVPAGRYAQEALTAAGAWDALTNTIVRGGSVRGVLEWVARGEVAAGVVYRTDAIVEDAVDIAFTFPPEGHSPVQYWAAPLTSSEYSVSALAFVEFAVSGEAGDTLFDL